MDAVEFLMNKARYCNVNGCACEKCTIYNECDIALYKLTRKQAERMVDVVDKWAKDHPIKTRQSEFLKMFPNAKLSSNGALCVPPCEIEKHFDENKSCSETKCDDCRHDYWMQKVE